jgi:hypothetical protein
VADKTYGFDPDFEELLAYLSAKSVKFYARLGHILDPDLIKGDAPRLALQACHAIANGERGPGSTVVLMQRLSQWHNAGKVTQEQLEGVLELLDDVEDGDIPDTQTVVDEAVPVLKRHIQHEGVQQAITEWGKQGDIAPIAQNILDAERLGERQAGTGMGLNVSAFDAIRNSKRVDKLPTTIYEIDLELGGMSKGSLGIIVAPTGGGKSMWLNSIAMHSLAAGLNVGIASLELDEVRATARLMAGLLDVQIDDLLAGGQWLDIAEQRLQTIDHVLGRVKVNFFTPKMTTSTDVVAWVGEVEREWGDDMHVLIVDYADKLKSPRRSEVDDEYKGAGTVYEGLRLWANDNERWCWTASQAKGGKGKNNTCIDVDELADSQNKGRVGDLVLTANPRDGAEVELDYFVAKHREGKSRFKAGPLPHDWAYGRQTMDKPFDFGGTAPVKVPAVGQPVEADDGVDDGADVGLPLWAQK